MQVYWARIFALPKKVDQILRAFLWKGVELKNSGAKVAWANILYPKEEGGLGFKDLHIWNQALLARHIWNLCQPNSTSYWVNWVKKNLIRDHSFWELKIPHNCSWSWRKLLKLRDSIRPHIHHQVHNDEDTLLWYDNWLPMGPIAPRFGERIIFYAGCPSKRRSLQ